MAQVLGFSLDEYTVTLQALDPVPQAVEAETQDVPIC